jgi:hypothetical protein
VRRPLPARSRTVWRSERERDRGAQIAGSAGEEHRHDRPSSAKASISVNVAAGLLDLGQVTGVGHELEAAVGKRLGVRPAVVGGHDRVAVENVDARQITARG